MVHVARKILIIGKPDGSIIQECAQAGKQGGYDICWYVPSSSEYWQVFHPEKIDGISMYSYPFPWIPKISPVLEMIHLWYVIRTIRASLIHVFMAHPRIYNVLLRLFNPVMVSVMGADIFPERGYHGKKRVFLTNVLLDSAQCLTSRSDFMDRALLNIGDYAHKVRRNTWGVDTEQFRPELSTIELREQLRIPPQAPVFFSMRGCEAFYKHHVVIEGFAQFLTHSNSEAFLIVNTWQGAQDYTSLLESLVQQQHHIIPYVRFANSIPRRQMPVYCNLATSAISIPPSDGMPQSLYETMACGSFHILGNLPQYKELIDHKKTGYFVALDDPSSLAEGMQWVIEHPDVLRNAAEENRQKVLKVADKTQQVKLFNEWYHELIQEKEHVWYHRFLWGQS